jgi:tetratricopeptide (TPR) repeat protein
MIKIGNIGSLLNQVYFLTSVFIARSLKTAENKVAEILRKSTVPGSRVDEILESMRLDLFSPRGHWEQAIHAMRLHLEEVHKSGNLQDIEGTSLDQATAILELDRFGRTSDLAEAEAALLENIQSSFFTPLTRFILAVIASRQARFAEAHQRLAEAIRQMPQPVPGLLEVERINAEAELARAEGRWEETVSKYLSLVDSYQKAGNRWEWARRLIDLGDALLARDDPGDRDRAQHAYHQSLEMFTDMGAPGYVQVLQQRLGDMHLDRRS